MARIPVAQERIRQPSLGSPGTQFRAGTVDVSPIARGVQAVGQGIAAADVALTDEANRLQEFETNRRFIEFQTEQQQRLNDAQNEIQPGAFGFTQKVQEDYTSAAKKFFESVPARLKPQYDLNLAKLESKFVLGADDFENRAKSAYYNDTISSGLQNLRNQVAEGSLGYDDAILAGQGLIASSGLSNIEKQTFDQGWRKDAASALWLNEYNKDPAAALVALGGGTPAQRQSYQRGKLISAMVQQESAGDPNAVSSAGAAGLMQVIPSTGEWIAKRIGDPYFPYNGTDKEKQDYLKVPENGMRYGEYYIDRQLKEFGGDVEAALIAYNAGPDNARKWLDAGRDYAALPKRSETEPYVRNIMRNMGGNAVDRRQFGDVEVGPGEFQSQFYSWSDLRNDRFADAKMDQGAVDALDQVTAMFGKGPLRITSGFRSDDHNQKVSFSKDSRHTHGDAFDIDVSGYSDEDKAELISMFVAAGARGLGHYDNGTIHVDFRQGEGKGPAGLSLWYNKNQSYKDGAQWFSNGINQGLASDGQTFSRSGVADQRFSAIDFDTRQKMITEAQKSIRDLQKQDSAAAIDAFELQIEQNPSGVTEDMILLEPSLNDGDRATLIGKLDAAMGGQAAERQDAIRLDLATNPLNVSEQDILDDPLLDDGQKATLINNRKAAVKQYEEGANGLALYQAGVEGNPLSKDDRASVDDAWKAMQADPNSDKYPMIALSMVQRRGIMPGTVVDDMRGDILKGDLENSVKSLDLALAANDLNPQSLAGRSGSTDMRNAVAEYQHYLKLGFTKEEAAQRVIDARKPGVEQASIPKEVQKKIDKIDANDVADLFDPGVFVAQPEMGPAISAQTMTQEYRDIYAEHYRQTGDVEAARARADEQFKRTYNVSNATGKPVVMRYPPEAYYPAVEGSQDYIQTQLMANVTEAYGEVENVELISVPGITDVDIRSGSAPRYSVLVTKEDGTIDTLPKGVFFQVDVPKAKTEGAANRVEQTMQRKLEFENSALLENGLPLPNGDLLLRVKSEESPIGKVVNVSTNEVYERKDGQWQPTGEVFDDVSSSGEYVKQNGERWSRSTRFVADYKQRIRDERTRAREERRQQLDDPLFDDR